ncbi:unnamed protein product [Periconia digitata]|uniref:Uncharacterized protein n=1 Tax=Periconia digitata TaxID=1303443 RepID=A0A9W4UK18_9PLEO|nr:unnamed protein product [Periconia digitata]
MRGDENVMGVRRLIPEWLLDGTLQPGQQHVMQHLPITDMVGGLDQWVEYLRICTSAFTSSIPLWVCGPLLFGTDTHLSQPANQPIISAMDPDSPETSASFSSPDCRDAIMVCMQQQLAPRTMVRAIYPLPKPSSPNFQRNKGGHQVRWLQLQCDIIVPRKVHTPTTQRVSEQGPAVLNNRIRAQVTSNPTPSSLCST